MKINFKLKPYIKIGLVVIILGVGGMWTNHYFAWSKTGLKIGENGEPATIPHTTSTLNQVNYRVEEVARGLDVPWSFVFTNPTRLLISERPGRIVVVNTTAPGEKSVLYTFTETSRSGEEGLMSIVLAPDYTFTKVLYAAVAYKADNTMWVKVVTLIDQDYQLVLGKIIIDKIPAAQYHAGTALAFGPDGKLYISTGDATDKQLAQDLNSLAGKILRVNPDGTIPNDNPFPNSAVYSYGHRNPQGLAWMNKNLYSSEHGPSIFDGPAGGDEINLISKGKNYGWPLVSHEKKQDGTEPALQVFTPAEAPASLLAYTGKTLPQFTGNLFFGALKGEGLVRITLDSKDASKIVNVEKLAEVQYSRIRAVVQGPDGFIYFSTSNRDGRGKPANIDDRIFRIRPE